MAELTYERYQSKRKKPGPTSEARAKRMRAEDPVKKAVRDQCVERDYHCRLGWLSGSDVMPWNVWDSPCDGPSQWAHMHDRRRSQTRGQAPELRHDTAHTLMLCARHHLEYDQHRLRITALTRRGADGPLKFSRAKC